MPLPKPDNLAARPRDRYNRPAMIFANAFFKRAPRLDSIGVRLSCWQA
jgi:hypothetical protein